VSNPKVRVSQKSDPFKQPKAFKSDSASTFSEEEIRSRAYQIYESRGRTNNHADEDWSQAQTELMELVGGKIARRGVTIGALVSTVVSRAESRACGSGAV
jgi:hypothetical protein